MSATRSQQKGKRFEKHLLAILRAEVDANTRFQIGSGNGTEKGDIYIPSHSIYLEAKNEAETRLIPNWEQAKAQALGDNYPVLAIRHPRKAEFQETLIVIDLPHFIELLNGQKGKVEVTAKLSWQDRNDLNSLIRAAKSVLERFDHE
ncbi:hypothetical protein [Dongia sp.]|uniref:hypothetical protein n=1 Tax=Dongia sp. TaxID=1977262 RepID=UPI0037525973